jgi:hydrogenase-4 component B
MVHVNYFLFLLFTPSNLSFFLLFATFSVFCSAILVGIFSSRKIAYLLGAIGSSLGLALSFFILITGNTLSYSLWNITQSSFAKIQISWFNAYFLLISCAVWVGICTYSLKYDDDDDDDDPDVDRSYTGEDREKYGKALSPLLLLTILSMILILVSGDAILFLIGWESMTIASFFMILEGKGVERKEVINAAFLFLAFGEASSVIIMLAFSGIFSSIHSLDFLSVSSSSSSSLLSSTAAGATLASGILASWVFVSALVGFGLKMGVAPFHMSEWLPIAHSSAPSNASALLSSTLTLMGVYGLIDIVTRLGSLQLWWGWIALGIGGISAMLGALHASASEHSKGLPAYSTIENNGLIIVAIGAYILATYYGLSLLAELALIAVLYHSFSHSISKGSMFAVMGWVSKLRRSFDFNEQNAPISNYTGGATRLGGLFTVLSLAAVPPLAGFVSEWLILEVLFQSFRYGDIGSQIIGTLVGAVSALAAGIIIVAMTKAYGFGVLLSKWSSTSSSASSRAESMKKEKDRLGGERGENFVSATFLYFIVLVLGVGVAAPSIFFLASKASIPILGTNAYGDFVTGLLGVPANFVILSGKPFGGFSPTFTAIFMLGLLVVPFLISRARGKWNIRRTSGWFGGGLPPKGDEDSVPRVLYNSFGYSAPIKIMMKFLFRTKENVVRVDSSPDRYLVEVEVLDIFKKIYLVLFGKWFLSLSELVGRKLMPGRLSNYIVYIMAALIFVMLYVFATTIA